MRIFTGSPHPFEGNQAFFDRDSGLLSRGFCKIGVLSEVITLGSPTRNELPQMNHATWHQMEDPDWWKSLDLNGLILITWGNWRFGTIVKAASQAGIRVAQMTDTLGNSYPMADFKAHLNAEKAHYWFEPRWKQVTRMLCKLPITLSIRLVYRDRKDARAIASSEWFFAPTPGSAERYRKLIRFFCGCEAAKKVRFIPFPVNFHFKYSGKIKKQNEVVAVGRWDSTQKRTPLLMRTISRSLDTRPNLKFRIFGRLTPELEEWHRSLSPAHREKVTLEGMVDNSVLAEGYQRAKVILVSAAYEGCHNASAEALCSGASVVGCRSPFLGVLEWHASKNSGRLADSDSDEALSTALMHELDAWDRGERDPVTISHDWASVLHSDRVAQRILSLFSEDPDTPNT